MRYSIVVLVACVALGATGCGSSERSLAAEVGGDAADTGAGDVDNDAGSDAPDGDPDAPDGNDSGEDVDAVDPDVIPVQARPSASGVVASGNVGTSSNFRVVSQTVPGAVVGASPRFHVRSMTTTSASVHTSNEP